MLALRRRRLEDSGGGNASPKQGRMAV